MRGRIIMFLIFLFFIFLFNAADFAELYEGVDTFFPIVRGSRTVRRISAVFPTSLTLWVMPLIVFDLQGIMQVTFIILLEAIYILIYISLYFFIKKKKEKDDSEDNKR